MRKAFPRYLIDAMAAAGLSPADLARASGVNSALISRWRNGENKPSIEQLRAVAAPLGVRLIDLVVAAGHLTAEEAGLAGEPVPPPAPVWSPAAIEDVLRAELGFVPKHRDLVVAAWRLAWDARNTFVHDLDHRTAAVRNIAEDHLRRSGRSEEEIREGVEQLVPERAAARRGRKSKVDNPEPSAE